jgi:hypothetical protein
MIDNISMVNEEFKIKSLVWPCFLAVGVSNLLNGWPYVSSVVFRVYVPEGYGCQWDGM